MDRTKEFRILAKEELPEQKEEQESSLLLEALDLAKEQILSLFKLYSTVDRASSSEYAEIERATKSLVSQEESIHILLDQQATGENLLFVEGIYVAMHRSLRKLQEKIEAKRSRKRKPTLNIALEPEKATPVKHSPPMMQLLHEENERILESVQYIDREIVVVQRRISEIDTLQKLIAQEIFAQDERIDVILSKTTKSTVDVRISRNYLKTAIERKNSTRRFLSVLIFIFSIMIMSLHLSK
ncbi:hypothetical protein NEFER03_2104 [Nematocida sp. LUAm3]|nr:hypothetical protein NEFER03_2104 [Nematocida sp. LUAm3]KAI5175644.1 hypothetical protein NEFER02_1531 [Nematocida sp. LUAm2]KAI5178550.1 hypothetical protein NEFER01_1686 [Nematocida sp. LUAm1]